MSLPNIIRIFRTIKKLRNAQEFSLEIRSGKITRNEHSKSSPSCMWHSYLTWYIFLPYIINLPQTVWELWSAQFFCFMRDNYISESCFFCTRHAYWSSSSSLANIIKLPQTVWELLPAEEFGFRGDNYITKKLRVVCLTCDTATGPLLHSYQILSKYV